MSVRYGVVAALDPVAVAVRVRFPDHDDVVSWWLKVVQPKTLHDKAYWMPDVGEHVVCLMDAGEEAGVVLGAIYSTADPAPEQDPDIRRTVHKDGAVESYDRKNHQLTLDVPVGGSITIRIGRSSIVMTDDEVVLTAPQFRGVQA